MMESFPVGPYYTYHIIAVFQQRVKLPAVLCTSLDRFDRLQLTGDQLTPPVLDALLDTILRGHLYILYLSPFRPAGNNDLEFHRLADQWGQARYTHGCGALIFDDDRSSVFLKCLDQYTLNQPVHLRTGDIPLSHNPIIFDTPHAMADAVRNIILTGSLDGTRKRPAAPSDTRRGVDPNLLFWIENVLGFMPKSPDDLKEITCLTSNFFVRHYPEFPDWLAPDPGNWSLLGDLPNLKSLFMPAVYLDHWDFLLHCSKLQQVWLADTNLSDPAMLENLTQVTYLGLPSVEWKDYSFLKHLSSLEILDLSRTDFRDCTILTCLPDLKRVLLPAERQLLHLELLDPLPIQVKTDPRQVHGAGVEPFELLPPGPTEPLDLAPPYKVLHIESDHGECEGLEITEQYVKKLMKDIEKGKMEMVYASLEPWGEDEFLAVDMAEGWASLHFSDSELDYDYCIYNPDHAGDEEDAPPEIGGQTPVPKQHAIQDLSLTAKCVGYFIKTGSLYPGAYWAKYYQ